jgi:hypothetical protein
MKAMMSKFLRFSGSSIISGLTTSPSKLCERSVSNGDTNNRQFRKGNIAQGEVG